MSILPAVCAVVVTYHPNLHTLKQLAQSCLPQVSALVLVDNGSDEQKLEVLRSLVVNNNSGVTLCLLELGENTGVAAAQNKGLAWAREFSYEYVLFLDQDSIPEAGMVTCLLNAYLSLSESYSVSAVGPVCQDMSVGNSVSCTSGCKRKTCPASVQANILISSGVLLNLAVIDSVKPMDESLFIDEVDTEWFLRARSMKYFAFRVTNAVLRHSLGDKTFKIWCGRWRYIPQHQPIRFYYRFRNNFLLYQRNYVPFMWKLKSLTTLFLLFAFSMFWMPERYNRLIMVLHGLYDAVRGRAGKRDF